MRIAGIILLIVGLLLGIGSNLTVFVDPPSIIIVVTFVLGALWISGASVPAMFRALGSGELDSVAATSAARSWGLAAHAAAVAGVVGVLIGAVIMLKNLDDIGALGPGLAICILTALYGLVIGYGFCLPCQRYVESKV
ncbi:MAG: hypothetical protein HN712_11045 [Gemmatimonadetes bacterium]|jgi:flagellar motor component MotA|nr:hypothetical protein [Gemmatimonadota bacterium]MBT7860842.1 hypothetical protein [Gemmatimonadota bacterium]